MADKIVLATKIPPQALVPAIVVGGVIVIGAYAVERGYKILKNVFGGGGGGGKQKEEGQSKRSEQTKRGGADGGKERNVNKSGGGDRRSADKDSSEDEKEYKSEAGSEYEAFKEAVARKTDLLREVAPCIRKSTTRNSLIYIQSETGEVWYTVDFAQHGHGGKRSAFKCYANKKNKMVFLYAVDENLNPITKKHESNKYPVIEKSDTKIVKGND